jgi:nucleoside-diphosphate-sugar epimerase
MVVRRILVTGGSGFIGDQVVSHLVSKGYQLVVMARRPVNRNKVYQHIQGDITDPASVNRAVKGVDIVVHMASIIDSDNSDIWRVNVRGTQVLVDAVRKESVSRLIYLSTDNMLFGINNRYTKTKCEAEELVKQAPSHLIIRPSIVYGQGEQSYFKAMVGAIQHWPVIPVLGDGQNKIQPIHVVDLALFIEKAIEKGITGTYALAGSEPISYEALIRLCMKHLNKSRPIFHVPLSVCKPLVTLYEKVVSKPIIDNARLRNFTIDKVHPVQAEAEKLLGRPFLSPEEGVARYIRELQA